MSEEFDTGFGEAEKEQKPTAEVQEKEVAQEAPKAADFCFDASDLTGPGVEVVEIGKRVSRLPVERAKFSKEHQSLISIVSNNAIAVKIHYREGFGSYFCLGAGKKCCELDGLPKVRYVFPVVIYDVDDDFKLRSGKLQYRALVLGQEQYDAIANIAKLNGDLSKMDLAVQCSDEHYQKCTYTFAGKCRYKQGPKSLAQVVQFWSENGKNLLLPVASQKTLEQITEARADDSAGAPVSTAAVVNFDKVFE